MKFQPRALPLVLALIGAVALALPAGGARADDEPPGKASPPPAKKAAPGKADEPAPPPKPPARDPFAPSKKLQGDKPAPAGDGFVPSEGPELLPALMLRGYVEDAQGRAVALLEVGGTSVTPTGRPVGTRSASTSLRVGGPSVYLVRAGDTVSLPTRGRNVVIRVKDVGNLSLRIEVGELRREVIVR